MFTALNLEKFGGLDLLEFLRLAFHGLRYDLSAIITINALYFVLLLLPLPYWKWPRVEKALQLFFVTTNAVAFSFEISDWAYFPFALKRSTIDVLDMVTRKSDFLNLLPHFVRDFWYAPVGVFVLVLLFYRANRALCRLTPFRAPVQPSWKLYSTQGLQLAVIAGLLVIGMRGGLQYIPIGNSNALQVADSKYVPVVLNTPFSIMHSYSGKLEEVKFYEDRELGKYFNPIKHYNDKSFSKKNVVVIILESFSKQFTGIGGRTSYTPFLDSLMRAGYVCTDAYANALHSAEGVPAVLSGMPSLMEEPITTSSYGTNRLTSLPALLREKGYETAFFHGGTNGTMSFDLYAANAGFNHYFGRTEYNNEADYDGSWGIWDEPYLQYFSRTLSTMRQPFMASVFTLSSHDPFRIPPQYEGKLPKGDLPVQQCIAYTDEALRKFFRSASTQPWFNNTLFVITSDHCSPVTNDPYYSSDKMAMYTIPIVFYAPGDEQLKGANTDVVQQIDILPTVLDYLGYNEPFFAFGNSAFRKVYPRFVVNGLSGSYQWYMNDYLLTANETAARGLYHFRQDSLCQNNLLPLQQEKANRELLPYFRAFVQLYRSSLIRNRLSAANAITVN